jgi:hypothetical protein
MSGERFVSPEVAVALDRVREDLRGPVAQWGPALEVYLPAAGVRVPVAHGLSAVPTGYQVWLSVGGDVRAADVTEWTHDVAFVVGSDDHTRARVQFVLLREEVRLDA